jgi:hypothetical protein
MSNNPYYSQEGHGPYELIGIGELELEEGGVLPDCRLAVATHGALNAAKDNAILVPTWYSGTSKIMEQVYIGAGRAFRPAQGLGRGRRHHRPRYPRRPVGRDLRRARLEGAKSMMRAILFALLAAAATIGGETGAHKVLAYYADTNAAPAHGETETRKTHEINVPRLKDGAIKGYAVMLLSYTLDLGAMKKAVMAPDSILVDEAFRYVYNDETIDFDHLDRFDLGKMSKALIRSVNTRVKGEVIIDVGVEEFTYEPYNATKQRQ